MGTLGPQDGAGNLLCVGAGMAQGIFYVLAQGWRRGSSMCWRRDGLGYGQAEGQAAAQAVMETDV